MTLWRGKMSSLSFDIPGQNYFLKRQNKRPLTPLSCHKKPLRRCPEQKSPDVWIGVIITEPPVMPPISWQKDAQKISQATLWHSRGQKLVASVSWWYNKIVAKVNAQNTCNGLSWVEIFFNGTFSILKLVSHFFESLILLLSEKLTNLTGPKGLKINRKVGHLLPNTNKKKKLVRFNIQAMLYFFTSNKFSSDIACKTLDVIWENQR